jgi:hypothetical protein
MNVLGGRSSVRTGRSLEVEGVKGEQQKGPGKRSVVKYMLRGRPPGAGGGSATPLLLRGRLLRAVGRSRAPSLVIEAQMWVTLAAAAACAWRRLDRRTEGRKGAVDDGVSGVQCRSG